MMKTNSFSDLYAKLPELNVHIVTISKPTMNGKTLFLGVELFLFVV